VEQRLRAFPDICLRAREAEGMEALLLKHEIRIIKNALSFVSGNPYYRILPAMYFHVHTKRKVAENITCDQSTVHRNRNKMLGEIALRIYGVEAWVM